MANELKPAQRVALARNPERPGTAEFVSALFTDFFEQRGDRCCMDDGAIYGGVGLFHGKPVTVIGHRKGHTLEEHVAYHFGMPSPEGYRKAQRLMLQAEKFRRPIVTFIDTAGAYPGLEAEAHGQGEAIASTLALSSRLTVPVISIVTGEGGSGGALALGVGNRRLYAGERCLLGAFPGGLCRHFVEGRLPLGRGLRRHEADRRRPAGTEGDRRRHP